MPLPKREQVAPSLKTVTLPVDIVDSLIETHDRWDQLVDELEDYLLVHNPTFIKRMRRAQKRYLPTIKIAKNKS